MKAKGELILALDIGTSFVKAILARIDSDGVITILSAARAAQARGAMRAGSIVNIPSVISTCEKAIISVESASHEKATSVVVGIAGEQLKCSTSSIHYKRKKLGSPISDSEMSAILSKVKFETGKKAQSEIAIELGDSFAEIAFVSSSLVSATIDGQRVENPIGFRGANLDLEFYTAFAPRLYISTIEEICSELGLDLISAAVDPFAICRAYTGSGDSVESPVILVDIGHTNTNVAVIDSRGIRGTTTFSLGSNVISASPKIWLESLSVSLASFKNVSDFPTSVVLCGGGAQNLDLCEHLAIDPWYADLGLRRRPLVSTVDFSSHKDIKNPTHLSLDPSFFACFGLLRVAADTFTSSEESSTFHSRLSRILKK